MDNIRHELAAAAYYRSYALVDINIHKNLDEQIEFQKQTILADESLSKDEKSETIRRLTLVFDNTKILYNEGTKRICENCQEECLATLYCELCIRNHLEAKFSNWTSENNDIDNLIQNCQIETQGPD